MRSLLPVSALTPAELRLQARLRELGRQDVAEELLLAKQEPGLVDVQVTGVASVDPPLAWQQSPVDHPFAKGKAVNLGVTTLGAAASAVADLVTAGYLMLRLMARIGNGTTPATALGDVTQFCVPYEDDGTTLFAANNPIGMAAAATPVAAALAAGVAFVAQDFDLKGLDKVRVQIKNNNVAALQGATLIYYLLK